jgi:hypothetical protein
MQKPILIALLLMCNALFSQNSATRPELTVSVNPISCYGKIDGSMVFEYKCDPAEPIKFTLVDSANKMISGIGLKNDTSFQINHLYPGKYKIQYYYKDKPIINSVIIENKNQLKANIITIKELSGSGSDVRARLEVRPSGGTLPYSIQWSENTQNQKGEYAENLPQGIYRCFINDAKNCGPVSATFFLYDAEIEKYKQNAKSNN